MKLGEGVEVDTVCDQYAEVILSKPTCPAVFVENIIFILPEYRFPPPATAFNATSAGPGRVDFIDETGATLSEYGSPPLAILLNDTPRGLGRVEFVDERESVLSKYCFESHDNPNSVDSAISRADKSASIASPLDIRTRKATDFPRPTDPHSTTPPFITFEDQNSKFPGAVRRASS
ncbi:hypothetical protein BU24DRAFT_456668 [Aaosphaeria arxii CBS 175.79]|uniref:Uncharacterized protein n=1 Tax=Aaosphaeria arxii CBS 175.79 TaxID=1450172 RepID=A0A6A5Y5Q7_9PLEO|nr:uncharacterized protein BU24DRAFT_456668 [Aaosphaeria arxii CBS 175.79]KAF2020609.1 hypothetical protein BU24DRAFT_456668 [Aaosphaeria arxii CBS 175.79]